MEGKKKGKETDKVKTKGGRDDEEEEDEGDDRQPQVIHVQRDSSTRPNIEISVHSASDEVAETRKLKLSSRDSHELDFIAGIIADLSARNKSAAEINRDILVRVFDRTRTLSLAAEAGWDFIYQLEARAKARRLGLSRDEADDFVEASSRQRTRQREASRRTKKPFPTPPRQARPTPSTQGQSQPAPTTVVWRGGSSSQRRGN